MSPFGVFFGWPAGGVWSNLLASAILAIPGGFALARKLRNQHRQRMAQAERHHTEQLAQATAHHNAMRQLAETHHQALKDHITAQGGRP